MKTEEVRMVNNTQINLFDWRTLYELFIRNIGWFVLSVIICVGAMVFHLMRQTPVYQRTAVLLVKAEDEMPGKKQLTSLLQVNAMSGGPMGGIDNELYILSSNQLMGQVVDAMHLDIAYTQERGLRTISLYDEVPFVVRFENAFSGYVAFDVKAVRKNGILVNRFLITGENGPEELLQEQLIPFDSLTTTPVGNLRVTAKGTPVDRELVSPIQVSRVDKRIATSALRSRIGTSAVAKMGTLVNIVCQDTNPNRAEAILNHIMNLYMKTLIDDKNQVAAKTAEFIDERISIIGKELGDVEGKLTDFKQQHGLVDIKTKVATSMAEGSKAKDKSVELTAQLNVAQYVRDFVTDVSKQDKLIPNVSGIRDAGVEKQIQQYNELLLRRNRLQENSGAGNAVVEELNQDLTAMRSTIEGSLDTYCNTISLRIDDAQKQERETAQSIKAIPMQEKKVLDVTRQQAIKERLYTYLLQNREELAMQLAGTQANLRVVEAPFGSLSPVAPRKMKMLALAFLAGLVIPFVYIFIRSYMFMGIRGRKDVEHYTTIPVLGDVPTRADRMSDDNIVVSEHANDHISEAFRLLRTNLSFFQKDAKVLMFTSTIAHEGKTFVSRNLAVTLALSGMRVILVDTDLRKGKQSRLLSLKSIQGVSNYLSGNNENLKELILPKMIGDRVDFLPSGTVPPNPSELLMSKRLEQLIEALRGMYDYVIVDNVPAQVVADAAIVNRVADATLYVMRDGVVDRRYLPELERIHQQGKFKHLSVIINDVKRDNGGYGYGYGYGYFKEEEKRKNKILKKLKK